MRIYVVTKELAAERWTKAHFVGTYSSLERAAMTSHLDSGITEGTAVFPKIARRQWEWCSPTTMDWYTVSESDLDDVAEVA